MIEIIDSLPEPQRELVRQHEGLTKARLLALRYRRLVRELTLPSTEVPAPALLPLEASPALSSKASESGMRVPMMAQ